MAAVRGLAAHGTQRVQFDGLEHSRLANPATSVRLTESAFAGHCFWDGPRSAICRRLDNRGLRCFGRRGWPALSLRRAVRRGAVVSGRHMRIAGRARVYGVSVQPHRLRNPGAHPHRAGCVVRAEGLRLRGRRARLPGREFSAVRHRPRLTIGRSTRPARRSDNGRPRRRSVLDPVLHRRR